MLPRFQGTDDGKEFLVIHLVVSFCGVKGLGKVSTGMICSILISFKEDCTCGHKGSVGGKGELPGGVRIAENRFREKALLQLLEGFGAGWCPSKLHVLLA